VISAKAIAADLIQYSGGSKCEEMQVDVTFEYNPEKKEVSNFRAIHHCQSINAAPPEWNSPPEWTTPAEWAPGLIMPMVRDGNFKDSFKGEDHRGYAVRGKIYPNEFSRGNLSPTYPSFKCNSGPYLYKRCYSWEAVPVGK